jgi:membrane protein DedA with SNARE-associated domain
MTDFFLDALTQYGPLALGLALVLGAGGLPIPIGLLMLVAGAFARQGLMDWQAAALVGLVGVVAGDVVSYLLGRVAGGWVQRSVREKRATLWQKAQTQFNRHGALAIWLTRFVLTSLDVPTNLIAGGSSYAFRRFLAHGLVGRVLWLALYGGLGYAFGSQWSVASQAISQYSGWLGFVVAVGIGAYLVVRFLRQRSIQRKAGQGEVEGAALPLVAIALDADLSAQSLHDALHDG